MQLGFRLRAPICADCYRLVPNAVVFQKIEAIMVAMQSDLLPRLQRSGSTKRRSTSAMLEFGRKEASNNCNWPLANTPFTGSEFIHWLEAHLELDSFQEAAHLANLIVLHGYIYPINDDLYHVNHHHHSNLSINSCHHHHHNSDSLSIGYGASNHCQNHHVHHLHHHLHHHQAQQQHQVHVLKSDSTQYQMQAPALWPSRWPDEPESFDYAVYLCKKAINSGQSKLLGLSANHIHQSNSNINIANNSNTNNSNSNSNSNNNSNSISNNNINNNNNNTNNATNNNIPSPQVSISKKQHSINSDPLHEYERESLIRLHRLYSHKWHLVINEAFDRLQYERIYLPDQFERKLVESRERAFWAHFKPAPGALSKREFDIKKLCRLSKVSRNCSQCQKLAIEQHNYLLSSQDTSMTSTTSEGQNKSKDEEYCASDQVESEIPIEQSNYAAKKQRAIENIVGEPAIGSHEAATHKETHKDKHQEQQQQLEHKVLRENNSISDIGSSLQSIEHQNSILSSTCNIVSDLVDVTSNSICLMNSSETQARTESQSQSESQSQIEDYSQQGSQCKATTGSNASDDDSERASELISDQETNCTDTSPNSLQVQSFNISSRRAQVKRQARTQVPLNPCPSQSHAKSCERANYSKAENSSECDPMVSDVSKVRAVIRPSLNRVESLMTKRPSSANSSLSPSSSSSLTTTTTTSYNNPKQDNNIHTQQHYTMAGFDQQRHQLAANNNYSHNIDESSLSSSSFHSNQTTNNLARKSSFDLLVGRAVTFSPGHSGADMKVLPRLSVSSALGLGLGGQGVVGDINSINKTTTAKKSIDSSINSQKMEPSSNQRNKQMHNQHSFFGSLILWKQKSSESGSRADAIGRLSSSFRAQLKIGSHSGSGSLKGHSHSLCPSHSRSLSDQSSSIDTAESLFNHETSSKKSLPASRADKLLQSYLTLSEQWKEYDPFLCAPIPSNPWLTDSSDFWDMQTRTDNLNGRRIRRWTFSLRELLQDPAGKDQFSKFLEKEFSAENLKFWDSVQQLKRVCYNQVTSLVEKIWNEYLAPEANCPINIDSRSFEATKANLKRDKCNRNLYDEAANHVYLLMRNDSYPRYLRSDLYKSYLNKCTRGRRSLCGQHSIANSAGSNSASSSNNNNNNTSKRSQLSDVFKTQTFKLQRFHNSRG